MAVFIYQAFSQKEISPINLPKSRWYPVDVNLLVTIMQSGLGKREWKWELKLETEHHILSAILRPKVR